jgi:flagellar biosynthesis protein FliQ
MAPLPNTALWACLVAALWFLGPVTARHSMNALETGLITLMLVLTLLQFFRVIDRGLEATLGDRIWLGALAGITFLARIDAALLCILLWGVWMLDMLIRQRAGVVRTLVWLAPPGILCLVLAAPWLLNNLLRFGSLMPSSGTAQSLDNSFGENAILLPSRLFEYIFPMLPVPNALETVTPAVIFFAVVVALVVALFLWRVLRTGIPAARAVVSVYALYGAVLSFYYGFNFGAPHFLTRYLAPIAPLLIVSALWAALELGRWLFSAWPTVLARLYGFGGLALCATLLLWLSLPGVSNQGHFQVVEWVQENVPEDTWVGAVQTGTLGYWHDRTINLDGKVNPEALAARSEHGTVLHYVVESEIDYVVDWAGVGRWAENSEGNYSGTFELIVEDFVSNLSVQRRIGLE